MRSTHSILEKIIAMLVCVVMILSPIQSVISPAFVSAAGEGSGGVADTPTPVAVAPGIDSTYQANEVDKVKRRIDYQILFPLYLGALNAVTMVAQQLAYDTAEWVANGGKGTLPLYQAFTNKDYIKQLGYDAAGEFIGTVSQKFTEGAFGINLCRPPRFQGLALEFALRIPSYYLQGINRPKPKCSWTDITDNWKATRDSLTEQDVIKNVSGSFTTGGNDVSFGLGLNVGFLDMVAEQQNAGIMDRLEGKGFKSVQSLISGHIQTPASVVEQSIHEQIVRQPNASQNLSTTALLGNAFQLGWVQLGTVTLSTFSNVLISRLLGKVAKGLFDTSGTKGLTIPDFANSDAAPLSASGSKSEQIISEQYRDILTPKIATAEAQDLLGELLGCPDTGRTKWNCAMDQSMEAALRQGGMTVRQAIDQGFINAQFQLIPSTQLKDNIDSGCAQRAFCVANLRKLRLARIIPVGWELAADSPANQRRCTSGNGCITLREVIDHFDDCDDEGQLDDEHPWCHLIDPNWVLTSFQAQCMTKGYGNSFIAGTGQRMQECQDTITCLEKDPNGKCSKGYGYCLAEQTYYQFDSLACKEQYVSCRTYTPRGSGAKPIGYLRSSLDYGSCDATNVGCMWYSSRRNPDYREGQTTTPEWLISSDSRMYFNKNVERCDAAGDGCSDLRKVVKYEPSLNLIRNSSFETVDASSGALEYWVFDDASTQFDTTPYTYEQPQPATGLSGYEGANSLLVASTPQQVVALRPGHQYTVSFYGRAFTNPPSSAGAAVTFYRPGFDSRIPPAANDGEAMITDTTFFKSSDCATGGSVPSGGTGYQALVLANNLVTDWQRFQCSFVAPAGVAWARVRFIPGTSPWLVDGVKLEESEVATAYNEGLNPNLTPTYLRIPPAELACSGDETLDNPLCKNFAKVCRAYEAGCQGYTPKNQLSAPEVPAVLSSTDLCPAECVGYAKYRKQASTFDLVRNADVPELNDPDDESDIAFIPSTGKSCSAQDVGCEAFTVVDEAGNSGEQSRAFSYLRLCDKPNDETQTYYTWEGSEASGYQLVTWSLQRDLDAPAPQGPRTIVRTGRDGLLKDSRSCNEVSYLTGVDPDCRQFYDPQGNAFYRYESQTVLADAACVQLRKTGATVADCEKTGGAFDRTTNICVYQAVSEKSNSCDVQVAGCRAYLGTQGGAQSTVLSESFASDEYVVNAVSGVASLNASEESVLVGDRSLRIGMNVGTLASVAFDVPTQPGMLYELSFWAKSTQSTPYTVSVRSMDPQVGGTGLPIGSASVRQQWNVYRVGPFTGTASITSTSTRIVLSGFSGSVAFLDTIHVTQVTDMSYVVQNSWQTPDVCDRTVAGVAQPQAMLGCQDYVDRKQNTMHVRQFSNLCRESSVGCTAYIDTKNSTNAHEERWMKSSQKEPSSQVRLSRGQCITNTFLYPSESIRTQIESEMATRTCYTDNDCGIYNAESGSNFYGRCDARLTVRSADEFVYYIDNGTASCKQAQVGCRAFGLPKYDQTRLRLDDTKYTGSSSVTDFSEAFETVYLKDDSTKYTNSLCSETELFCEAYAYNASGQSGTEYFRAPSTHACEYKEGVVVARNGTGGATPVAQGCNLPNPENYVGTTYDGWFRVGTDCPCYPELLNNGKVFGIRLTGDVGFNQLAGDPMQSDRYRPAAANYQAWAGVCPKTEAECTEFRDVNDKSDPLHPLGRPYFVINDERLDKDSCNGKADPGNGCVLFRDLSNSLLTSNSLATFNEYVLRGYQPVAPVDCSKTPDLQACIDARTETVEMMLQWASSVPRNGTSYGGCTAGAGSGGADMTYWSIQCLTSSALIQADRDQAGMYAEQYLAMNSTGYIPNDTNIVIKVKADRSCSQWLACKTGETVYDQTSGQYKSICSQLELCNKAGSNEGEGVPFCQSYVNRAQSSVSTVLTKHRVLTAQVYASRPTRFGSIDYSGFTIPDQFQVVDTVLDAAGSQLTNDPKIVAKYKKDYRLLVRVPAANGGLARALRSDETEPLAGQVMLPFACVFLQTGAYGLLADKNGVVDPNRNGALDSGEGVNCILSVDQSQPAQMGVSGAALVADNLNTLTLAKRFAQAETASLDQMLSRSFPNTQCKAAPQADAPYGNEYVTEWDDTVNPPATKRVALGYGNASFCEYGEDCACTYKKVSYGKSKARYYEPLSTNVVNAVCVGGSRDGLPCVPNSGVQGSQNINVTVTASGTTSGVSSGGQVNMDQRCGEGGVCTAISDVTLVRGMTGQCLEYDVSRPIAGDQTRSECLVWNPNPVLAGPSDPYHWSPTAGFQPPQSSGRYYCTSAIHEPRTQILNSYASWPSDIPEEGLDWMKVVDLAITLTPVGIFSPLKAALTIGGMAGLQELLDSSGKTASCGDGIMCKGGFGPWPNSEGTYAGRIKSLFYADWYTSDGDCDYGGFLGWKNLIGSGCTGNVGGASLDGTNAGSMAQGKTCENIDQFQGMRKNENLLRLVTTAQGTGRSYAEYAILFNPWQTAYAALGFPPTDWETAFYYSLDDVIANFEFSVPKEKIECAYTNSWSSAGGETNEDHWRDTDKAWHAAFSKYLAQGGGTLNRSRAQIVTEDGSPTGIPVKTECVVHGAQNGETDMIIDGRADDNGLCYMRTWELDYRAEGMQKFMAFTPDIARNGLDHLSRRPVYGKCDSSNPWFSIRAVFEDTNHNENIKDPESIRADQLIGPFQFVGVWVTACNPGDQTQFIYMDMKMNSADVCRELAETISKDSHDSAAYTDRNWTESGYSLKNGFSWDTTNMPFGASLATGDAGEQPLFMTGVKQTDVNPMNPPTFTSPGQTYFSSSKYPTSNWGLLSNVFAKIYRIYGYDPRVVTRDDWACTNVNSPNFGKWCPPLNGVASSTEISQQYCGVQGKCIAGGIDGRLMFSKKVCNSFSGVNRGLDCSSDPDICHIAPMRLNDVGMLEPQFGSCQLFSDGYRDLTDTARDINARWSTVNAGGVTRYRCEGSSCPNNSDGCTYNRSTGANESGCTKALAIRNGAFRCSGSLRDPGIVRELDESNQPTYASYCTKESANSSECPVRVLSDHCTIPSGQAIGTCDGYPWAQCGRDLDCSFEARNFYPSGSVNDKFNWTRTDNERAGLGYHSPKLNQSESSSEDHYIGRGSAFFYAFDQGGGVGDDHNLVWFNARQDVGGVQTQIHSDVFREAFWPAVPMGLDLGGGQYVNNCGEDGACFYGTQVSSTRYMLTYDGWNDTSQMRLYPGFVPTIWWTQWNDTSGMNYAGSANVWGSANGYPGTRPIVMMRVTSTQYATEPSNVNLDRAPYVEFTQNYSSPAYCSRRGAFGICLEWAFSGTNYFSSASSTAWAHYASCEAEALMFRAPVGNAIQSPKAPIGTCRGGGMDGAACASDANCVSPQYVSRLASLQASAGTWCNPVTSGPNNSNTSQSYRRPSDGRSDACWPRPSGSVVDDPTDPKHPQRESDPSLDNNLCTHPAGYWPKPQYCLNPDDEYCGLFGYSLGSRSVGVSDYRPLPTDVSGGFYSPRFLWQGAAVSQDANSYNYVDYYNPIPPHTAAPDVRTCQGQQCRITSLDSFSVDGLAEGVVNGGIATHVATVRFYGWAAHNQMPLRKITVDWGDGTVTTLPDSYMKNRKPYCGGTRECSEISGLSCQTDADCPPGGGLCVNMGFCSNAPNRSCFKDVQCGTTGGFCQPRVMFGNDEGACEEQYFEFRHSFSCLGESIPTATCNPTSNGYCSRNPTIACADSNACAIGDTCVQNMSSSLTGCFDSTRNVCRFTPRIKLTDNWGWCSGECRNSINAQTRKLEDNWSTTRTLHMNGGCYDGSLVRNNVNLRQFASINECGETSGTMRPWIVFPGSIQIRRESN